MLVKFIVIGLFIFSTEASGHISEIFLANDEVFTLSCTYDKFCSENMVFKTTQGHLLRILVKSIDINGENGDFLLVKSGEQLNDGTTGRIFTHHTDREREYVSVSNTALIHFHINESEYDNINFKGIVLTIQRLGERSSPTTEQTTELRFPPDVSRFLTVSVDTQYIFDAIPIFRDTVAQLAINFTSERTDYFGSNLSISAENVNISRIANCSAIWPRNKNCYEITFMLPISIPPGVLYYGQYQMTEYYLQKMWIKAPDFFSGLNITVYDLSHHRHIFITWISVICAVVVVFGISLLIIGHVCEQRITRKRRNIKEEDNTFDDYQRNSVVIIEPHPLQGLPSQFRNDVTFYDPDTTPHLGRISGLGDPFEDIILDRNNLGYFDNQRGSIPEQSRTSNI